MNRNWHSLLPSLAACLLATICAACQPAPARLQPVNLPGPPACLAPVALPPVKAGDDARAALARHRAALIDANGHLVCGRRWYAGVRQSYGEASHGR